MVLRIKVTDFSEFSGYKYNDDNAELNKYIDLFKNNPDFSAFQIEDNLGNQLDFHTVCCIKDRLRLVKNIGMFTRTDLDDNGNPKSYWLCFYKEK